MRNLKSAKRCSIILYQSEYSTNRDSGSFTYNRAVSHNTNRFKSGLVHRENQEIIHNLQTEIKGTGNQREIGPA